MLKINSLTWLVIGNSKNRWCLLAGQALFEIGNYSFWQRSFQATVNVIGMIPFLKLHTGMYSYYCRILLKRFNDFASVQCWAIHIISVIGIFPLLKFHIYLNCCGTFFETLEWFCCDAMKNNLFLWCVTDIGIDR